MTTLLQKHIDYWNHWHTTWHQVSINNNKPTQILQWPIPDVMGGSNVLSTELPSVEFFPEPYWGNIFRSASSIFINYNPGGGGHPQHIKTWFEFLQQSNPLECHILWDAYAKSNLNYANTIQLLSTIADYPTTNWLNINRESWANELSNALECIEEAPCEVKNTVMFEYCPWHTVKASSIMNYISGAKYYTDVPALIEKHILEFAVEKASKDSCGPLRKIIFSKGTVLSKLISDSINNEFSFLENVEIDSSGIRIGKKMDGKGGWLINVYKINDVFLVNCHGVNGGGNGFPKATGVFLDIIKRVIALRK